MEPSNSSDFLQVINISKNIGNATVLNNISFSLNPFFKLAIAGETGSGKSTLLKIIGGLVQTDSGSVLFEGRKVKGPLDQLLPGHKSIGYVSQQFELRNNYKIEDELDCVNQLSKEEAAQIYEVCQITHLLTRKTDQVSGGERQRIATARVLIASPKLLLLDEPFSNLDATHKQTMKEVIDAISNTLKITCILISHDPQDVLSWADELIILQKGNIVQQASPKEIYFKPANIYTAGLFGKYNIIPASILLQSVALNFLSKHDKACFIRPSQIIISQEKENTIAATVQSIQFQGNYFELKVLVENSSFIIHTSMTDAKIGETVFIKIDADSVFYLKESIM